MINHLAATLIGAGIATIMLGTGIFSPKPEPKKRAECALSYTMPDNMAARLFVPCEIVSNAAARSAVIQDRLAGRRPMGLASVPFRGKEIYDRLEQNDQPKNDYSMIIEKKKAEKAKKK